MFKESNINGLIANCEEVLSRVPHRSVMGPVLLNIFICDLEGRTECVHSKFVDNTNLDRVAGTLEDKIRIQNVLDKLLKC